MPATNDRLMTLRFWLRTIFATLGLALAAIATPAVTQALPGAPTHIRNAIEAETSAPAPGGTTTIALVMTPDPEWHGYWKNGGDAGFGMRVTWHLPPGVTIGDLSYPVPQTLVIAGLMNHVYEHPYALLAPLRVDASVAPGTRLPIRGDAVWLACTREVCVPEAGSFSIDLVAGDGAITAAARTRFDALRTKLPLPLTTPARFAVAGDMLRIAVPLPASRAIDRPHLFVESVRANEAGAAQSFTRSGDTLIIETRAGSDIGSTREIAALLAIGGDHGLTFTARPGSVPPAGTPLVNASDTPAARMADGQIGVFLVALAGALIGGLILNVMPCVFPILSLKALALARAGGDAKEVRAEGFAYTAGTVLTCLALGAILLLVRAGGEAVGWAFQLQRPESVLFLVVLMSAMTANLAGLFEFGSVSFGSRLGSMTGTRGAFATGALAAFVATPCSGPFLGAALGATLVLPAWAALPIFGGLGFGLALPFLAIALIPALRRMLPRPGTWMVTLRRWLAVPMALTALALIWVLGQQTGMMGWVIGGLALGLVLLLGYFAGRLQAKGDSPSVALFAMAALVVPLALLLPQPGAAGPAGAGSAGGTDMLHSQAWSEAKQAQLISDGHPLLVYFTADWCLTCKVNEATAINRSETQAAFNKAGVRTLVGDWTNGDPAITRALAAHGRNSVPLYLWFPKGSHTPQVLPQVLSVDQLTALAGA